MAGKVSAQVRTFGSISRASRRRRSRRCGMERSCIAATDLVMTPPELLVGEVTTNDLRIMELPAELQALTFTVSQIWHECFTRNPAHLWPRRLIKTEGERHETECGSGSSNRVGFWHLHAFERPPPMSACSAGPDAGSGDFEPPVTRCGQSSPGGVRSGQAESRQWLLLQPKTAPSPKQTSMSNPQPHQTARFVRRTTSSS